MNVKAGVIVYDELYWGIHEHDWYDYKNHSPNGIIGSKYSNFQKYRLNKLKLGSVSEIKLPICYGQIDESYYGLPKIIFDKTLDYDDWGQCKLFPLQYDLNMDYLQKYINELGKAVGIIDEDDSNSIFSEKGFIGIFCDLNFHLKKELYNSTMDNWKKVNKDFKLKDYILIDEHKLVDEYAVVNFGTFGLKGVDVAFVPFHFKGKFIDRDSELLESFWNGINSSVKSKNYNIHNDFFYNNYLYGINTYQDIAILKMMFEKLSIDEKHTQNEISKIQLFNYLRDNIRAEKYGSQIRKGGDWETTYDIGTSGIEGNLTEIGYDKYLSHFKYHPSYGKSLGTWGFEQEIEELSDFMKLDFLKNYSKEKHIMSLGYQKSIKEIILSHNLRKNET